MNATVNTARLYIVLKPHNQRANADENHRTIAERDAKRRRNFALHASGRRICKSIAGSAAPNSNTSCRMPTRPNSTDWTPKLVQKLGQLPQLSDVASDQQTNGLQLNVDVDREKASRLNVLTQAIDDTLYDAFGQRQVSIIFTQLNQFRVILEVEPKFRSHPDSLDKIYVKSSSGQPVPLSAFACVHVSNAPLSIPHQGQFPAVTLSFNLRRGSSLRHAIPAIEKAEREIGLPNTVATTFSGSGGGISFIAHERAVSDFRGRRGHLHRAGSPLRELHSSDHDSFDPAERGRGRVARADHLPHRFLVSRAYRNHFAHWDREEERDHDDRFCARSGT